MNDHSTIYPLRFEPIFRRYIWGGRRLETLGKEIGEGDDYAESWEIVDHRNDQTRVAFGPLTGMALKEIVNRYGPQLFGRHATLPHFPLLFKFLDCNRNLSVQVHPDDRRAAALDPPDLGKTEAWIVINALPGSVLYAGLKQGVDQPQLTAAIERGNCEELLHQFEPSVGDCIFIPAGVVHALGAGLVVAEIQQASDTTYRLFDWNRVGADGQPRPLHLELGLEAIDYTQTGIVPQRPQSTARDHITRLVECDKFVIDRWQFNGAATLATENRFRLLAVLGGSVSIASDPAERSLKRGDTMLVPAVAGEVEMVASENLVMLDAYLP